MGEDAEEVGVEREGCRVGVGPSLPSPPRFGRTLSTPSLEHLAAGASALLALDLASAEC